tara:strand:- start:17794 stop:17997 length:204 start_codon:yes stop_codon:yes gene_type:complete
VNKNKTIKNWKWWLLLLPTLFLMGVASIPAFIIFLLELTVAVVQLINVIDRPFPLGKRILEWVHKDT